MNNFKIGDYVRVVKPDDVNSSGRQSYPYFYGWTPKMDQFNTKIYVIQGEYYGGFKLSELDDKICYNYVFDPTWLEPAYKYDVGDVVYTLHTQHVGSILRRDKIFCNKAYYIVSMPYTIVTLSEDVLGETTGTTLYMPVVSDGFISTKKKKSVFVVLSELSEYFTWSLSSDKHSLLIILALSGKEHVKYFDLGKEKKAYKWLVKQACKLSEEFNEWYNG